MVVVVATADGAQRRREVTLAGQFLLLQLVVVALLLVIVGALSVRQSTDRFTDEQGAQMRSVANYVANLGVVRSQLYEAGDDPAVRPLLASLLAPATDQGASLSSATDVSIVAADGEVVASTDPALVGTDAVLGDSTVLSGRQWSGDVDDGGERAVAGHVPVIAGPDSAVVGAVLAEQTYPTTGDLLTGAAPDLVLFLGLGALLGGLGTYVVSRVVKRRTQGLGAREFAELADHRQALLHSIGEGVVAVGTDGRVTVMNDAARAVLGVAGDPVGRPVDDLGLPPEVVALLAPGTGEQAAEAHDAVALVDTRVVVFNRRAASAGGRGIGSVTTVRDRTELVSLQSQLSSNLSITDTLRAQTHEFDNQLHTISGLVQLGEYDELGSLVGSITRARAEVSDLVSRRLLDPAVAALVVAKTSVADERGVSLLLDPGSHLPPLPGDVSADLTTVLGNLVDNAVDACAGAPEALVEVWLTVVGAEGGTGPDHLHLRVRDNGPGVPGDLHEAIFVRGFSTKSEVLGGRGIGLPLVQLICVQRGGRVEVGRAEAEGGAEFSVVLPLATTGAPA